MSFGINIAGHLDTPDPEKDREIIRAAIALSDALERAGIPHAGSVYTPFSSASLPPAIRVGKIEASSATPTGHKKP